MATGDLPNNLIRLKRQLVAVHYPVEIDDSYEER